MTNDREFAQREKKRVIGHFIFVNTRDVLVREIFNLHVGDVVLMLQRHDNLFASVSRERIEYTYPSQTRN